MKKLEQVNERIKNLKAEAVKISNDLKAASEKMQTFSGKDLDEAQRTAGEIAVLEIRKRENIQALDQAEKEKAEIEKFFNSNEYKKAARRADELSGYFVTEAQAITDIMRGLRDRLGKFIQADQEYRSLRETMQLPDATSEAQAYLSRAWIDIEQSARREELGNRRKRPA